MTRAPFGFRFYRFLTNLVHPVLPLVLIHRAGQLKEDRTRLGERRGEPTRSRPAGPLIWVHGASVGETLSLLPLIEELTHRDIPVLATSGTVTSSQVLARRLPDGATHQFMPMDSVPYVRRFLDHWRPDLAIFVESEIWPNMLNEARRRSIPMVLANARLSDRSFSRWKHVPDLARFLYSRFDLCLAQTQQDAERLVRVGAQRVAVVGNLKFDALPPPAAPLVVSGLQAMIGARPVWLAASTHAGEEAIIVNVHRVLQTQFPDLLTIIAPRHPERGRDVAAIVARAGLNASQRSAGLLPDSATDIYVADTIGELGLLYRVAPIVFVGGSLVPHGGQNPIEPAKLGSAIVHGPYVHNFEEVYDALDQALGSGPVSDGDALAASIGALLADPALIRDQSRRALDAVQSVGGALRRTMAEISPYLLAMHLGH